jgi:hypothetical protein
MSSTQTERHDVRIAAVSEARLHAPNEVERSFLQIVTLGYPELHAQVMSCEVDDYDLDGYCDIHVISGPSAPVKGSCDGPSLREATNLPEIDTILWINDEGFLENVEVVGYGAPVDNIYERFIEGARASKLRYKHTGAE